MPVGRNDTRYSMEVVDPELHPESRDRLQKQLDRFMKIRKTDNSYTIVPFGVKGDRFKEQQLRNRKALPGTR